MRTAASCERGGARYTVLLDGNSRGGLKLPLALSCTTNAKSVLYFLANPANISEGHHNRDASAWFTAPSSTPARQALTTSQAWRPRPPPRPPPPPPPLPARCRDCISAGITKGILGERPPSTAGNHRSIPLWRTGHSGPHLWGPPQNRHSPAWSRRAPSSRAVPHTVYWSEPGSALVRGPVAGRADEPDVLTARLRLKGCRSGDSRIRGRTTRPGHDPCTLGILAECFSFGSKNR